MLEIIPKKVYNNIIKKDKKNRTVVRIYSIWKGAVFGLSTQFYKHKNIFYMCFCFVLYSYVYTSKIVSHKWVPIKWAHTVLKSKSLVLIMITIYNNTSHIGVCLFLIHFDVTFIANTHIKSNMKVLFYQTCILYQYVAESLIRSIRKKSESFYSSVLPKTMSCHVKTK